MFNPSLRVNLGNEFLQPSDIELQIGFDTIILFIFFSVPCSKSQIFSPFLFELGEFQFGEMHFSNLCTFEFELGIGFYASFLSRLVVIRFKILFYAQFHSSASLISFPIVITRISNSPPPSFHPYSLSFKHSYPSWKWSFSSFFTAHLLTILPYTTVSKSL